MILSVSSHWHDLEVTSTSQSYSRHSSSESSVEATHGGNNLVQNTAERGPRRTRSQKRRSNIEVYNDTSAKEYSMRSRLSPSPSENADYIEHQEDYAVKDPYTDIPPIVPDVHESLPNGTNPSTIEPPVKKRKGRPPKITNDSILTNTDSLASPTTAKRGPGRPKGVVLKSSRQTSAAPRLPGRRRQPNADMATEISLNRMGELRRAFKVVSRAHKAALETLSSREIDRLIQDSEAHKRATDHSAVTTKLESRRTQRLAILERKAQLDSDQLQKRLGWELYLRNEQYKRENEERREDRVIFLQKEAMRASSKVEKTSDAEATDDESNTNHQLSKIVLFGRTKDDPSRSRHYVEHEMEWKTFKARQKMRGVLEFYALDFPQDIRTTNFATMDISFREAAVRREEDGLIFKENLDFLLKAASELDRPVAPSKPQERYFAGPSPLDALADVAGEARFSSHRRPSADFGTLPSPSSIARGFEIHKPQPYHIDPARVHASIIDPPQLPNMGQATSNASTSMSPRPFLNNNPRTSADHALSIQGLMGPPPRPQVRTITKGPISPAINQQQLVIQPEPPPIAMQSDSKPRPRKDRGRHSSDKGRLLEIDTQNLTPPSSAPVNSASQAPPSIRASPTNFRSPRPILPSPDIPRVPGNGQRSGNLPPLKAKPVLPGSGSFQAVPQHHKPQEPQNISPYTSITPYSPLHGPPSPFGPPRPQPFHVSGPSPTTQGYGFVPTPSYIPAYPHPTAYSPPGYMVHGPSLSPSSYSQSPLSSAGPTLQPLQSLMNYRGIAPGPPPPPPMQPNALQYHQNNRHSQPPSLTPPIHQSMQQTLPPPPGYPQFPPQSMASTPQVKPLQSPSSRDGQFDIIRWQPPDNRR